MCIFFQRWRERERKKETCGQEAKAKRRITSSRGDRYNGG